MLNVLQTFLNRPLAEDFSVRNQARLSVQAGLYIFLITYLLGMGQGSAYSPLLLSAVFALGCAVSSFLANFAVPRLAPVFYDEDRWTVSKHAGHVLLVLLCVTIGNQLILYALDLPGPSFVGMYVTVTIIGFFPIITGVMVAEQRRLKRNLAHAQTLNNQLAQRPELVSPAPAPSALAGQPRPDVLPPNSLVLVSDTGKERLSLQPDQLLYVESVGNYVDVHWLNVNQPQKTTLRSTLKDVTEALGAYPQFFRCHRAFVVNLNAVSHTEGNARGYQLTLTGTTTNIPVSRTYIEAFDRRLISPA